MAENKKKVVVYTDWLQNFEDLTDEELGKLMRHFFEYINDLNPVLEDRLLKIAWKPLENTLKRDLKKWESFVDKQKENGSKGGRPKSTQKTQAFNQEPKKADSDNVSDSVNESEINNNNNKSQNSIFDIEVNESTDDEFTPSIKKDIQEALRLEKINNSIFTKECKKYTAWSESVAMTNRISVDVLNIFLDTFEAHLINYGEQKRSLKEFKSHFNNWLSKQNLSQFRNTPVGKSNQVNYGN